MTHLIKNDPFKIKVMAPGLISNGFVIAKALVEWVKK